MCTSICCVREESDRPVPGKVIINGGFSTVPVISYPNTANVALHPRHNQILVKEQAQLKTR